VAGVGRVGHDLRCVRGEPAPSRAMIGAPGVGRADAEVADGPLRRVVARLGGREIVAGGAVEAPSRALGRPSSKSADPASGPSNR
jgi:hypothetical protein